MAKLWRMDNSKVVGVKAAVRPPHCEQMEAGSVCVEVLLQLLALSLELDWWGQRVGV